MRPVPSLLCILSLTAQTSAEPAYGAQRARPVAARPTPSAHSALEARIRRIETGLLPANLVSNQPLQRMPLLDRMSFHRTPGVSIAVINNYRVEWARGYGVRVPGSDQPVRTDTLFQAASVSKPVVAAATLRLVEQGRLALDRDVNAWLRTWRVPDNEFTRTNKVTIRGILTHTAGFRIMAYPGTPVGQPVPSTLDLLEGRQGGPDGPIRVAREPGSQFEYSGAGFIVLQQLLEDVSGRSFPQLIDNLVFRRVGMANSTFEQEPSPEIRSRMAAGMERGNPIPGGWLLKPNMASGGLWTTASDVAAFAVELQKAAAGRRNRLLGPAMAARMMPPRQIPAPAGASPIDLARGLGIEVAGEGPTFRFSHGGINDGYRSLFIALGDGRGLVVLTNGSSQVLIHEIVRAVATEYGWPVPEYLPIPRTVVTIPEAVLQRYAGRYEWPIGRRPQVSEVTVQNGQLMLEGVPLQAESETRFFGQQGQTYTFGLAPGGGVRGFRMEVPGLTLEARKLPD